jgi:hypothetical protein
LAIAEEVIAPGETAVAGGKRMLAVLKVTASDDLAISITRLLAPQNLNKYVLTGAKLFVRYTVVQDCTQRRAAENVFQRWLTNSVEAASGMITESANKMMNDPGTIAVLPTSASEPVSGPAAATGGVFDRHATVQPPAPLPSGF